MKLKLRLSLFLSLLTLFEALSNKDKTIRNAAKSKIKTWKDSTFNGKIPKGSSIAVLGIVSFSVRNKLKNEMFMTWNDPEIRECDEINKRLKIYILKLKTWCSFQNKQPV